MAATELPPIDTVPQLGTERRAAILDALFEPCTALHTLSLEMLQRDPFRTYNDLIAAIGVQLTELHESSSTSDTEWLDTILGSHPRLGAAKVESVQSQKEQAQLNTGGENEADQLRRLNDEYEARFPGLRYVVFVDGRARAVIMDDMKARISRGEIGTERTEAIKAMCDIAADRVLKLSRP